MRKEEVETDEVRYFDKRGSPILGSVVTQSYFDVSGLSQRARHLWGGDGRGVGMHSLKSKMGDRTTVRRPRGGLGFLLEVEAHVLYSRLESGHV